MWFLFVFLVLKSVVWNLDVRKWRPRDCEERVIESMKTEWGTVGGEKMIKRGTEGQGEECEGLYRV